MPIVRVGPRGQITVPTSLRQETHISTGSFLEAEVRHNVIVLKPVKVVSLSSSEEVEMAIAEGLEDHQTGRVGGPYKNMAEFKASRSKKKTRRPPHPSKTPRLIQPSSTL